MLVPCHAALTCKGIDACKHDHVPRRLCGREGTRQGDLTHLVVQVLTFELEHLLVFLLFFF